MHTPTSSSMPVSLQISYLYMQWSIHDGKPSRYAAMLHFLYLWMWDGKNQESFPTKPASDLMMMAENQDKGIRAIAICAFVFMAIRHGHRLPSVMTEKIQQWTENNLIKEELADVQKYLFASVTGIKIQKQIQENVLAKIEHEQEVMLERKESKENEENDNEDSEESEDKLMSYINKLNELVKDGLDINVPNFITNSKCDFFLELRNWLIEFDPNTPLFQNMGQHEQLTKSIFAHTEMCDLDKHALLQVFFRTNKLDIISPHIPPHLMDSMMQEDDDDRKKMQNEEYDKNAYRYAMQNLFRLFSFSPWRGEMTNPFTADYLITDCSILAPLINDNFLWNTATLLIRHSIWGHPAAYLRTWMQRNGETEEALQYLALCDKHLGNNKERLYCLLRLEENNPDDLQLSHDTGHCLIKEERYEDALKRFFRLEVNETHLHSSARAIAWCSMMLGNMERAQRYYNKLLNWKSGPSWEDLLNAGHCAWLQGNPVEASILYGRYLAKHKDNLMAWDEDCVMLLSHGISADDIELMRKTITE